MSQGGDRDRCCIDYWKCILIIILLVLLYGESRRHKPFPFEKCRINTAFPNYYNHTEVAISLDRCTTFENSTLQIETQIDDQIALLEGNEAECGLNLQKEVDAYESFINDFRLKLARDYQDSYMERGFLTFGQKLQLFSDIYKFEEIAGTRRRKIVEENTKSSCYLNTDDADEDYVDEMIREYETGTRSDLEEGLFFLATTGFRMTPKAFLPVPYQHEYSSLPVNSEFPPQDFNASCLEHFRNLFFRLDEMEYTKKLQAALENLSSIPWYYSDFDSSKMILNRPGLNEEELEFFMLKYLEIPSKYLANAECLEKFGLWARNIYLRLEAKYTKLIDMRSDAAKEHMDFLNRINTKELILRDQIEMIKSFPMK